MNETTSGEDINSYALQYRQYKYVLSKLSSKYCDIVNFTNARRVRRKKCLKKERYILVK